METADFNLSSKESPVSVRFPLGSGINGNLVRILAALGYQTYASLWEVESMETHGCTRANCVLEYTVRFPLGSGINGNKFLVRYGGG